MSVWCCEECKESLGAFCIEIRGVQRSEITGRRFRVEIDPLADRVRFCGQECLQFWINQRDPAGRNPPPEVCYRDGEQPEPVEGVLCGY